MQRSVQRWGGMFQRGMLSCAIVLCAGAAPADETRQARVGAQDQLWRRTLDSASKGDFESATDTIQRIHGNGDLVGQVRSWLKDYEQKQAHRRDLNRADLEKYVGYAKARIARKEYPEALGWSLKALECASDRETFLKSDWLSELVNVALVAADTSRKQHDWKDAYHIYSLLSELFEHEPRYQKLEREVLTLLRLDAMFEKDSLWKERLDKVRWKDAEMALRHIEGYYVVEADFKEMTERGLEQLLLLAESKTARERFDGLRDEDDRNAFVQRIETRLDQVRAQPTVTWDECRNQFRRAIRKINRETANLPEELVISELMQGALEPLDDFTTIIWPQDSKEFDKHTRGDFVGVGISIIKNRNNEIEVATPLEDTPAYRAGVQAGDIITAVDGVKLENYSLNKVVDTITGPEGTDVTLTIRRGDQEIPFPLTRAKVRIRSVKGVRRDPFDEERWDHWLDSERGIAYIRVTNFQRNTVEDVDNILSELSAQGLKGLVLDLRRNPGGLLDSAWQLSSRFLKRGDVVVSTRGRIKSDNATFEAPGTGAYSGTPLVVLVDERSASASEIVSGAVRDNGRGIVIGERTFGKFSVQNLVPLGRSGAKLKITTARYHLPSGASLHRDPTADEWGVSPDISVPLVRKEIWNIYTLWREANLLGPPKSTEEKTASQDGEASEQTDDDSKDQVAEVNDETAPKDQAAETEGKEESDTKKAELPRLEQPDENDRPKEDPQLDTALLVLRLMLVGDAYPTLATAETETAKESANP